MAARFSTSGPDLNRLQAQLLTSGLQQKDPPLYQVISQLIANAIRLQALTDELIAGNTTDISTLLLATFITHTDEAATLINSRNLLAGTNVTFDDATPNERTINVSAAEDGVWTPLSDGDPDEPDIIFNSFGEVIMIFVPNP